MKAVVLHQYGGPEQLRYEETDRPECGENEVLVRVKATSVNPVDLKSGADGVLGSVLGTPDGAQNYPIRVEAMMAVPGASRLSELADDFSRKEFDIPISRTMRLEEAVHAHRLAEGGGVGAKIILIP